VTAGRPRAVAWVAWGILFGSGSCALAGPAPLPSELAQLASRSLLIDIAAAGSRLVAAGDRGHVLLSDDQGRTWVQAADVPVDSLLTGVCFSDASHGIAVGHDEVILTTQDGGQSWKRTHYAPEAQQPLLDVWCGQAGHAIAVGAYGVYLTSADAGATWIESKLQAQAARKPSGRVDTSGGYHLNAIVAASPSQFFIAAEAGHLYRSDDGGSSWIELPSPYEGSFFGILPLGGDTVLAYGLRGNLFRSEDAGITWQRVQTGTVAMLDGGAMLGRSVVVIGLSGVVLVSRDAGKSFTLIQQSDRKGLSAAVVSGGESLVTVGEAGVKIIRAQSP